jgi:hypothetical protein
MDDIDLTTIYLGLLKEQQAAIDQFLQTHQQHRPPVSSGVHIALDMYTDILEDASKTLTSLIQYFERPSNP